MKIFLIRHGKTEGNRQKRYIGLTDEPLCPEGIDELGQQAYPAADYIVVSPMRRCIQTAQIVYPGQDLILCEEFRECNFGDFEGKNYRELAQNAEYQRWIDSGGVLPFPNGEAHEEFTNRCCRAFQIIIGYCPDDKTVACIVHGGTIMSILERYAVPGKGFFDYQIANGACVVTEYDRSAQKLTIIEGM